MEIANRETRWQASQLQHKRTQSSISWVLLFFFTFFLVLFLFFCFSMSLECFSLLHRMKKPAAALAQFNNNRNIKKYPLNEYNEVRKKTASKKSEIRRHKTTTEPKSLLRFYIAFSVYLTYIIQRCRRLFSLLFH